MKCMVIKMEIQLSFKPGPASTEGDRPPTNPEIQVQFPPKQMNFSFSPWQKNAGPDLFKLLFDKKYESAIYWKGKSGLQFYL